MPSPWLTVPVLYCRIRMVASHAWRRKDFPGEGCVMTHNARVVISGAFQLHSTTGAQPYFFNNQVGLRVQGHVLDVWTAGDETFRQDHGSERTLSSVTTAGATLQVFPEAHHLSYLKFDSPGIGLDLLLHEWQTLSGENGTQTEEGTAPTPFYHQPFITLHLPDTPGDVRVDQWVDGMANFSFCSPVYLCKLHYSGILRLTPGIPAFRIVDDSAEENPIPHCRVRVLGPDGVEHELVTDEAGDIFITRSGDEVYTLLEVLRDDLPLSTGQPGEWTVDVIPDLP